jgi:vacuolar-type H+-ATPase subunit H
LIKVANNGEWECLKITEVLNNVKQAEIEAKKRVERAKQQAAEIVDNMDKAGEETYQKTYDQTVKEYKNDFKKQIDEILDKAENEREAILSDTEEGTKKVRDSSKNHKKAINALLEELTIQG